VEEVDMDNMMTIVMVSDMNRSVRFYSDMLGLKLRFESPDWSEFDLGGTTLSLHGGGKPAPPPIGKEQIAGTASIGFTVSDVDKTFGELKAKGVRFVMEPTEREGEGIRLAVAIDPDGLGISFAQVKPHEHAR
jgi:lactoylglutathione lyase